MAFSLPTGMHAFEYRIFLRLSPLIWCGYRPYRDTVVLLLVVDGQVTEVASGRVVVV